MHCNSVVNPEQNRDAMPYEIRETTARNARLLLVVHARAGGLFSVGVGCGRGYGAALPVSRDDASHRCDDLAALLLAYLESVIVNLGERPQIDVRTTGHWVILAVELAGPFGVGGFSVGVDSVRGERDTVASHGVHDGHVLRAS